MKSVLGSEFKAFLSGPILQLLYPLGFSEFNASKTLAGKRRSCLDVFDQKIRKRIVQVIFIKTDFLSLYLPKYEGFIMLAEDDLLFHLSTLLRLVS